MNSNNVFEGGEGKEYVFDAKEKLFNTINWLLVYDRTIGVEITSLTGDSLSCGLLWDKTTISASLLNNTIQSV